MNKALIKKIILNQNQEIKELLKDKIIERSTEKKLKVAIKDKLIKVIIGVRRSGKSVLAHKILENKNYGYVNFDDERLASISAKDLNDVLEVLISLDKTARYLLFDEIQNVAGWELFVNRLKRMGYNIIVTGSNSKLLSKELATHLTGRHFAAELFPFSFREFLTYKQFQYSEEDFYLTDKVAAMQNLLDQYISQGGFPELFQVKFKEQYLRDLYQKIILQDIVARHNIRYVKSLKELALYVLSNFGRPITYHKLKNIFEIKSVHTIKNYLDYFEEAYLIFQLYPFSFKLKNQFRGIKKIYTIDAGLAKSVAPADSPDKGRIIENIVFLELKRRGNEIYYYMDYTGKEVDFIIKEGLKIKQLIQVCQDFSDVNTKQREFSALIKANKELKCNNLMVVTYNTEEYEEKYKGKKIKIIPLRKFLLQ